jgi:16S rRNA (guanine966-N2)-methyltransferase
MTAKGDAGEFRIIGGEWRRRRLSFPARPGVRPTADRVRETLFNWLQNMVPGARCLDLFAGSGALGLEALSRGAAHVTFVDRSPPLLAAIEGHLAVLGASPRARCVAADALRWLDDPGRPGGEALGPDPGDAAGEGAVRTRGWDLVFLDPPFDGGLLEPALERLAQGHVAPGGRVYIEHGATEALSELPAGWRLEKNARAGNVRYHLAVVGPAPAAS